MSAVVGGDQAETARLMVLFCLQLKFPSPSPWSIARKNRTTVAYVNLIGVTEQEEEAFCLAKYWEISQHLV